MLFEFMSFLNTSVAFVFTVTTMANGAPPLTPILGVKLKELLLVGI